MRSLRLPCLVLVGVLGACGAALCVAGCSRIMGTAAKAGGEPIPDYPEGPTGLEALFTDVLNAAKTDDRDRVHDLFQSLKMSNDDLTALFGARSPSLQKPYDEMMASLIHRGAVEIVAVIYEKKYDTVEVVPIDVAKPRAEDAPLVAAMVDHPPLYAVRFKRAGQPLGTRYDFMFYRGGKWRTGNQLGRIIAKADAKPDAKPAAELTETAPHR